MNFLKKTILVLFLIFTYSVAKSQSYQNAAGVRAGASNGISFKHFVSSKDAIEVIANTRWRGLQLIGLYERHQAIAQSERFNFYYGLGVHAGVWDNFDNHPWFKESRTSNTLVAGIDGIIGAEYAFKSVPFSISLDWKPELNIIGYTGVWVGDAGFSIRYYW